ncbi:MAG: SHOCT domain-containing protein [Candidatus Symbiothrix sp.]|jgi:hypothetical protein|nr:SHOCT domain-containing protein [Candidatus Symbiothrix sp.]
MAGKLKDDQIRIILDVEAKGVQAELQKITASSFRYAESNKTMNAEMKAAQDQMKESLKEMKLLEKQGLQTSKAYENYENTLESARAEVEDYTRKIAENTQKIAENEKQTAEIIRTMNIQDMTMSQLKQRAADLQNQMNNTSAALSPEAYKTLDKELNAVKNRMGVVGNANKNLLQQFAGMNDPVGHAAKAILSFGQALKALIANPIGIVIMAIVAAFYALKTAIAGSDEASTKFEGVMKALGSILDSLKRMVTELVAAFVNFVKMDFSAMKENIKNLKEIGSNMAGNAKAAYEATLAEDALNDAIAKNNDITAVNKARIEELRQATQDSTKSLEERKKASTELLRLETENYKMAVENVAGAYKIFEGQNKNLIDAIKKGSAQQFAEVEKYMQMVQEGTELTYQQRLELANLVNDITTTLDKGTEEEKEKFRSFFSELSSMQQEYFAGSRRDQKRAASLDIEAAREAKQKSKEALDKRLQDHDNAINIEINNLKKSRLQGELTEEEYNKKVEQLTIDSLNRKINIKGQEKDKIIQIEQQILDAQIKQQELADKELLEVISKEKNRQLQVIESNRNKALEILQDQETDQKIYALRVAEIESQTASKRLETIQAFDNAIIQADFNNQQNRLDALEVSGKEILSAEESNLKQQANLRKLFAKTTADFERQYNIKTWEQRKADELTILNKQHEAGLLSEEIYQLALVALDKKYEDEKFKVRQQYALNSMSELYLSEMDALQEQYDKKLLSEEEFQKAQLDIKLKYAAELAQKSGEFTRVGSDTVKALEEAQTSKVTAEYTKRQSALTEQYNQGIISQEEYNAQKEQLDYEEKVKELEIQKKYADVNFAMHSAEIISSGAVAAINAYKSLAGIPVVGPALGIAAAALVAVTTGLQLSKAKAERDRVKAMTIESPGDGGGGDSPRTGAIRLKEGFSEGGSNTEDDLTPGGYTGQGGKYQVAGYVPIHHGEYVVDTESLKYPDVVEKVRAIEQVRRRHTDKNPLPEGFADGGSNSPGGVSAGMSMIDNKTMNRLIATLGRLQDGDIVVQTNYGVTELEAEQRKKVEAESKFTKE